MREIETRAAIIMAARRRARKIDDVLNILEQDKEVGRTLQESAERIVKFMERHYADR